jgi:hypothetical protein
MICPVCDKTVLLTSSEDSSVTWQRHNSSAECSKVVSQVCPVKACRTKMTVLNSLQCQECRGQYCLSHRYSDSHGCAEQRRRLLASRPLGCAQCHQVFRKSDELRFHLQATH